jgi:hypothetical protein
METKTIIKKGVSLTDIGIVTLIGIFGAFVMWSFIGENISQAGITINDTYNDSFTRLEGKQVDLENNVDEIKSSMNNITEADSTIQSAWNGLKGVLAIIKLPLNMYDTAQGTFEISIAIFDFIPSIVKNTIAIAIGIIVVFAFFKLFTNRSTDP